MKLEMRGQLRMEQQMKLAPRMIQSMEILQLPMLALQERIEQELNTNPVLEMQEGSDPDVETPPEPAGEAPPEAPDEAVEAERDLVVDVDTSHVNDFERLDRMDDDFRDLMEQSGPFRPRTTSDEPDKKLEALKNTAAPPQSLHEYLADQWRLIEAPPPVKNAGRMIIDYIDDRGYLTVRLEQLHNKDKHDFGIDDLHAALDLVQQLDPLGVGARDLRECLLIQIAQSHEDLLFEYDLVDQHLGLLLDNRLPEIAQRMGCGLDQVNAAVRRLSKFDTSPGLQIARPDNHPITADVIVEPGEDGAGYVVRLADSSLPPLRINDYYARMARDAATGDKARKFLQENIRSAQWIIDAIRQRKQTILNVTRSIVKRQRDFFDKGELYLKPLPMAAVAQDVGVHIATVSRAVSGKYVQCLWGVYPLRKFFSGGTESADGDGHSWDAIKAKLQQIVDAEDKSNPLSDDEIRNRLIAAGVSDLARRTVAKYRKLLNIPAARYRRKY